MDNILVQYNTPRGVKHSVFFGDINKVLEFMTKRGYTVLDYENTLREVDYYLN